MNTNRSQMAFLLENLDWNNVAENPECSQIIRDFARTKLAENNTPSDQWTGFSFDPIWIETIESCERYGNPALSDSAMVKIAAKVLLLDEDNDGCTAVSSVMLPDGTRDPLGAYPKLVRACRKILKETSLLVNEKSHKNIELATDANIVLASLLNLKQGGHKEAERYYKNALNLRPNDWRIHSAISAMYMKNMEISLSLECITRAIELVKSTKATFDLLIKKGKLLTQVSRTNDAVSCLEEAMVRYEEIKHELTDKDKGHTVNAQYALCYNYSHLGGKNSYKNLLKHWKEAEKKRSMLSSDTIARLSWDFRDLSQMAVANIKPDAALSHRECHYCHKVTDDVKKCSACKVAVYCSKQCQVKAWKSGHKTECPKAKDTRKKEKKEMKKPKQAVKFIDELLNPQNLYNKGVKLLDEGDPKEAAWNFLVALFMDFALDAQSNIPPMKKCVMQCSDGDVVALVLGMVVDHSGISMNILQKCERVLKTLLVDYGLSRGKDAFNSRPVMIYDGLKDVNRELFAFGAALVFSARWKSRLFQMKNGVDKETSSAALNDASKEIEDAKMFINHEQWLSFQFELGYSQFDIGAFELGGYWLQHFVDNLNRLEKRNGSISQHFQVYKGSAEKKLAFIPSLKQYRNIMGSIG